MYFCSVETGNITSASSRLTLRKSYKLRHKTLVDGLFDSGVSLYQYPLRFTYRPVCEDELRETFRNVVPDKIGPVQLLVTVPKKKLRHAVDRVLMRRRIRESMRLRMPELKRVLREKYPDARTVSVAMVYLDKNLCSSSRIGDKLDKLIARLADETSETNEVSKENP